MVEQLTKVKLKTVYPRMLSNGDGVFTDLQTLDVPWKSLNIDSALNYGYYLNSASKTVSPLVFDIKDYSDGIPDETPLTTEQRAILATMIYQMFANKWSRLWSIYTIEYNPIHDYNLVESETVEGETSQSADQAGTERHDITKSETDGGTDSKTTSETIANTGTDTTVLDGDTTETGTVGISESTDTERGIYGFNSATDQGSDTESVTHTGTETRNLAGTNDVTTTETKNLQTTDNTTESRTRNLTHTATNSDVMTKSSYDNVNGTNSSSRELQKSGNIGFNKPQEMLTAELELWQWNYFKTVFEDIDTALTITIY